MIGGDLILMHNNRIPIIQIIQLFVLVLCKRTVPLCGCGGFIMQHTYSKVHLPWIPQTKNAHSSIHLIYFNVVRIIYA